MKAKLIKTEVNYLLENKEGVVIASTSLNKEGKSLSKQNCDEIFGAVDVEKLAGQEYPNGIDGTDRSSEIYRRIYIEGFNKAMELNKDKVFTLEDMRRAFSRGKDLTAKERFMFTEWEAFTKLVDSIQPAEIDVEIVMYDFELPGKPIGRRVIKPKLDSEGCLVLIKKI
jgi:hypothetical protein